MAENLTVNPQSVVVVDMVGDADQQLYFERNSTAELSIEIWNVAAELGYADYFIPEFRHTIIDDHVPFLERLIPAIDIIDFDRSIFSPQHKFNCFFILFLYTA